jgi:hypothetical protein
MNMLAVLATVGRIHKPAHHFADAKITGVNYRRVFLAPEPSRS